MDTTLSTNREFRRMFANVLTIVVILALAFPAVTVAYAAPAAADSKQPVGATISLFSGPTEYPPNTPFHIRHGFVQSSDDDAIGVYDFVLEVDGVPRKEDFKDFWAESGDPDTLQRSWVFNFPNGMTGIHTFSGHWFGPCQLVVEDPSTCPAPNAKVEASSQTLTVNFTPTFVAYVPGAIEGYSWPMGDEIKVTINDVDYPDTAFSEQNPNSLEGTTRVLFEVWRNDVSLKEGDYVVMTDLTAGYSKDVVVTNLAVTDINEGEGTVSGLYDPGYDLWVWLYGQEWQTPETNSINGTWVATFDELPQGAWGGAVQHDFDGDGTSIDFQVPQLVLYIHYEYPDVVEGSYELGHTVQVTVFDRFGATKATATVPTMEMPHWGGAPGFRVEQWDGIDGPPDIQPGDVVRAVVDAGPLTEEARIGEIAATIDVESNTVTGTVNASWAGDTVNVLCMPWGAPEGTSEKETTVTPDGVSEFTCTWDSSEWDIQPGETAGVAYWGDDLHWIANLASNPWIMAFPDVNQVFGYGWPAGSEINLTINGVDIATATVEGAPWDANDVMAFFDFNGIHDLVARDVVMLSGGGMERTHAVQNLVVTEVDLDTDTASGTADPGATVHAWVHGFGQDVWLTVPDGANTWEAYLGSPDFHLQPGMCGRAEIRVEGNNSTNVDWCAPPKMDLRVNYGHDWVESFYEAGHQVLVSLTDPAGNIKATATAVTEPKWYWGDAPGFQTLDSVWLDSEGNQLDSPPDIQPSDWVYAQVDNGVTAQVQIGDIQGEVRFDLDSVTGTINVPWIIDAVQVQCLDWGSGGGPFNKDAGTVYTSGADPYSCNWNPETEWDVQPWQDVGVGYSTPDGHWVANAFRDERWMAFWTYDPPSPLFGEGEHSYYYQWAYTAPEPATGTSGPRMMTIAGDPGPIYDGFTLIGPWGLDYPGNFWPQLAWTGSACEGVSVLHPNQPMRFVWGWVNDYSMTYEEALAHFESFTIEVLWDFLSDGNIDGSATLATMSDLTPFTGWNVRFEYLCTFTEHP